MRPNPSSFARRVAATLQHTLTLPLTMGALVTLAIYSLGHFALYDRHAHRSQLARYQRAGKASSDTIEQTPTVPWPYGIHAGVVAVSILGGVIAFRLARHHTELSRELQNRAAAAMEQEQTYRALFERAVDGIIIADEGLHVIQANPATSRILGYTPTELRALQPQDYLAPGAARTVPPTDPARPIVRIETRLRRKDGSWIEADVSSSLLPDWRIQLILRDITERKATEARMRENEVLLRIAGRTARLGGWITPLAEDRVIWSDEVCAIHEVDPGYSPSLRDGIHFYAPEWREHITALFGACARDGRPYDEELEIITARGRRIWVRAMGEAVRDETGAIIRVQGAFQDVSESKRAREALQLSEARYRALVDHAPFAIYVKRADRVAYVNQACLDLFGAQSPDQLVGRTPFDLFDPAFHAEIRARIDHMRNTGEAVGPLEERIVRLDGRLIDVEVAAVPFQDEGIPANHVVLRDITERKIAERERTRGYELLAKLARQVPGVIYQYRVDTNGRASFPYCSPAMRELWELEVDVLPLDAAAVLDRIHPEDRPSVADHIAASAKSLEPFDCDFRVVLPRHGVRWRHSHAMPERSEDGATLWHGIVYDVTERRHVEEALRASIEDKEALLREVHHRVKNNLQVITSLLRLEEARADTSGTRAVLHEMQGRIRSMALLHESLHRSKSLSRIDLAAYIESICSQLVRATGHQDDGRIRFVFELSPTLVAADQAAPCGLIANELLSNALEHAFPQERGGCIRVSLQPVEGGQRVRLEVADDGIGLPPDFAARQSHSLGLQLVSDLGRQLDANLEIIPGPSETLFAVTFTPKSPLRIPPA